MNKLREIGETCVAAGIRAYIGLLGYGELNRSRKLFRDTLQLSAALAGGPSSQIAALSWPNTIEEPGIFQRSLVRASVASMLASLFVLRATVYWQKVPVLEALLESCSALAREAGYASGGTCALCGMSGCDCDDAGSSCGCRRNETLPTGPVSATCRPDSQKRDRQLSLL